MKKGFLTVCIGILSFGLLFGGCGETSAKPAAVYGFCPSLGVVQGSRDGNFYYLETPQSAKGGGYQLLLANSDYNDTARELFVSLRLSDLNEDHTGFIDRFYGREDVELPTVSAETQPLKRLTYSVGNGGYDTDALLSEDDVYLDYSGIFQLDAISEELPLQVEWMGLTLAFTLPAHPGADAIEALGAILPEENGVSLVAIEGTRDSEAVLYLAPYTDGSVYQGAYFGELNHKTGARLVHRETGEVVAGTLTRLFDTSAVFDYILPPNSALSDYDLQVDIGLNLMYESKPLSVSLQTQPVALELPIPYQLVLQDVQLQEQNGENQLTLCAALEASEGTLSPLTGMRLYAQKPDGTRQQLLPLDNKGTYTAAWDSKIAQLTLFLHLDNILAQQTGTIPLSLI